jgi:hypothetical protein
LIAIIDRLENEFALNPFYGEARVVAPEWYGEEHKAWNQMIERLYVRRTRVRELIWSTHNAVRDAFPNWNKYVCPIVTTKAIPGTKRVAWFADCNDANLSLFGFFVLSGTSVCVVWPPFASISRSFSQ